MARNIAYMVCRKPVRLHDAKNLLHPGCVLYSIHYGLWELMPDVLRRHGYDVGVLVNRYAHDRDTLLARWADRILVWYRRQNGVEIFSKHETVRIVRFLQRGGILGVLVDGNQFYSKMAKIQKLGRMCRTSVIPFAAYRGNGEGIVHIGCDLDRLVHDRPLDYMWFYRSRTT
ncbi:hypothetical protein JXB22_06405 [candidate division WOR-3 bacterium]|nr:hypothetical protein [candidate division WOR-3 bacterium]